MLSPRVAPVWQGRAVTVGFVLTIKREVWLNLGPRTVFVEVLDGTSVFKEEHEKKRGVGGGEHFLNDTPTDTGSACFKC